MIFPGAIKNIAYAALFMFVQVQAQSLQINEFVARNASGLSDNFDENDDWIEIQNTGTSSVNLDGYYLSDEIGTRYKHRLVASGSELTVSSGGFLILWADDDTEQGSSHLNFKLSGEGGYILLTSPEQVPLDTVFYGQQYTDISSGLSLISEGTLKFFEVPTPGAPNATNEFEGVAGNTRISHLSGYYNSPINIILSTPGSETARYTLNNTEPTNSSQSYTGTIPVSSNQVIRSISTKEDWISSPVESEFYLYGPTHNLPVLAILIDPSGLYGAEGIYDNPYEIGDEWEKFCQLKFFDEDHFEIASNAGIRIQGSSSVSMDKKSFRIFFRSEYGNGKLNQPVFGTGYLSEFNKLILKSGYDDDITTETGTLLRDALSTELWKKLGGLPQLSTWKVVYLNDQYWGIYNLRENIDETYIEDHTGYHDFDLVRFHNEGPELKYGTMDDWYELYDFISASDFSNSDNFNLVSSKMDMEEFITLMAMIHCEQYYSWSWGISMYKNNPIGLWKFSIWDTDRAFTNKHWNGFEELTDNAGLRWANTFYIKLMENTEFRRRLVNRICDLLNSVYKPEQAEFVLDSIYNIVQPEMLNEIERWNPDNDYWESNVDHIRDFLNNRPGILLDQIRTNFPVSTLHAITLDIDGFGHIKINGYHPANYPWQGNYFEENKITVEAIPDPDNSFLDWDDGSNDRIRSINPSDKLVLKANFTSVVATENIKNEGTVFTIYPNPSNGEIQIDFTLNEANDVSIDLWNLNGQLIDNIRYKHAEAGNNTVSWNGMLSSGIPLAKGVYILSLRTGGLTIFEKLIRIE